MKKNERAPTNIEGLERRQIYQRNRGITYRLAARKTQLLAIAHYLEN